MIGAFCVLLFAAVWIWQSPPSARMSAAELDAYLAQVEALGMAPEDKAELLIRLRGFGEQDDGKPFYMLNLMRQREALRRYPGAPETDLTPEQANQHYEDAVMPVVMRLGAYPLAAGAVRGSSVLPVADEAQAWDRVILVRYPSRRAFLELLTDPAYQPHAPYKFMAMETALVPVETEIVWPEYRWLAGGALLVVFLGLGWWRAARRSGS